MIGKATAVLIGIVAFMLLLIAFIFGYAFGQGDLCSDLGGVFVEDKCLDKSVLLER